MSAPTHSQNRRATVRAAAAPSLSAHTARVYRRIATAFLVLTAAVLVLAAYIVFAHAEVTVLSEPQDVKGEFIVDITRTPQSGEVRGTVFELSDTATQTFPSSSVVGIDQPATGKVRITSTLARTQTLIATTRLLTADGVLFRIKNTVVVPAGGSAVADAFATEGGKQGEVAQGTAFTIPGLAADMQKKFTSVADTAFVGSKTEVHSITQTDIDNATETLKNTLLTGLRDKMRAQATEGKFPVSGELIKAGDVSRISNAVSGSSADDFTLTVTVRAVGVFYDADAFAVEVKKRLGDKLYDGRVITSVDNAALERELEKQDLLAGRANIGVTARGSSLLSAATPALHADKLTGITEDAAKRYLESVEGVASASVKSVPFWIHRMPNVASHITVEVR